MWSRRIAYIAIAIFVVYLTRNLWGEYSRQQSLPDIPLAERHLHLLLTAPSTSIHLCKFLLTASVLGYPTPTIINWRKDYKQEQGHHVDKYKGIITYLDTLKYDNRRDLVVVVDAHDVWFQLRPAVLIERYHAINRAYLARLTKRPGMSKAIKDKDIKQSVIFAADKRCAASSKHDENPYCYLQPEPDTDIRMYGSATDRLDSQQTQSKFRPRYLNDGFVVGEAADLRVILSRAIERFDPSKTAKDQSPLSVVFAEQELIRETWRQEFTSDTDQTEDAHNNAASESHYDLKLAQMAQTPDHEYFHMHDTHANGEVHIGIDYSSLLSHSTALSERDWRHLAYNTTPPTRVWDNLGVTPADCNDHVPEDLPKDIALSKVPISPSLDVAGLPVPLPQWQDVPLYTDACTGSIPVTIHHNGDKSAIESQWPHLWLQPYAQQLRFGQARLAIMSLQSSGPPVNDGGAFIDDGKKLEWGDICENQLWGNELYDGKPFHVSETTEASAS